MSTVDPRQVLLAWPVLEEMQGMTLLISVVSL